MGTRAKEIIFFGLPHTALANSAKTETAPLTGITYTRTFYCKTLDMKVMCNIKVYYGNVGIVPGNIQYCYVTPNEQIRRSLLLGLRILEITKDF